MFSRLHRRMRLSPAGVIALIALVFAMIGGAYASTHPRAGMRDRAAKAKYLTKSQVLALIKQNASQGPAGDAGPKGDQGSQGAKGDPGNAGTSVTNTPIAPGPANANCKLGGAEFKVGAGTPTYACNGEPPKEVAKGETVAGAWSSIINAEGYGETSVSFPAPLHGAPADGSHVQLVLEGATVTGCPGTRTDPKADEGYACFYVANYASGTFKVLGAPSQFGITLFIEEPPARQIYGSWAVTSS